LIVLLKPEFQLYFDPSIVNFEKPIESPGQLLINFLLKINGKPNFIPLTI